MADAPHIPVMLAEVCEYMMPKDGGVYVDGTFGAGGYTRALLDMADCRVIAIDRDQAAIDDAQSWVGTYGDRLTLVHGTFGDITEHLETLGIEHVDGVVVDIGVSSMQIDQAERGFSFRFDGALDMRMDTSQGETAADVINTRKEENIANTPVGLSNNYLWTDLYGEGISGILTEQQGGWYYKQNFPFLTTVLSAQHYYIVSLLYIHTTSLIRKKHFPGFDKKLKRFQDWDLWLTMLDRGYKGKFIPEILFQVKPGGTMSKWLPKGVYKLPFLKQVQKYKEAEKIIKAKHKL